MQIYAIGHVAVPGILRFKVLTGHANNVVEFCEKCTDSVV